MKCSIALEVPHDILSIADLEERKIKMMQHISEVVNTFFKENNIDNGKLTIEIVKSSIKHGIKKDKMKFSFFQTNCMQADKPVITEGDKESQHNFFLIGDAYKNPIYPFGNGLNDALQHATELGRVIRGEQSLKNFSNNIDFITSRHSGVLTLILEDMGKEGVIEGLEEILEKAEQRALRAQTAQTQPRH